MGRCKACLCVSVRACVFMRPTNCVHYACVCVCDNRSVIEWQSGIVTKTSNKTVKHSMFASKELAVQ